MTWTQGEALALVREIEGVAPEFGAHVALTGGLLYKDGVRKDADILFYRIRQVDGIDEAGLFTKLADLGIVRTKRHGWVQKARWQGKSIDFFFPEYVDQPGDAEGAGY